jgi:predicted Co/Zn/Cd cation transporter (cation efflux family)
MSNEPNEENKTILEHLTEQMNRQTRRTIGAYLVVLLIAIAGTVWGIANLLREIIHDGNYSVWTVVGLIASLFAASIAIFRIRGEQ